MAKKGLSKLVIAKYSAENDVVTYANPAIQEKLAEYSVELDSAEPNNLYLDNEIAETDGGTFVSGTLNLVTGDLSNETSKLFFNTKQTEITVGDKKITEITYDDEIKPQELGVGVIELHQVNNVEFYRAVWLDRVKFNLPNNAATTKGETVEWQTQEISGTIMRSDAAGHPWKHHADCSTEAEALTYLMYKGGKTTTETTEAGSE